MDDYISREAAKDKYCQICRDSAICYRGDGYSCPERKAFDLIPAADVVEVRHGRWTDHRTIEHDGEWYCTACGEEVTICSCGKDKTWKYPYCPNCGADMREVN